MIEKHNMEEPIRQVTTILGASVEEATKVLGAPVSPGSSRSSIHSNYKRPLSVTTSFGAPSSRTSVDSSYFDSFSKKDTLSRQSLPPNRKSHTDSLPTSYPRHSQEAWIHRGQQTIPITTQRLARKPSTPTTLLSSSFSSQSPGEGFKKLPEEILEVIFREVRRSHLDPASSSCATCLARDLSNVSISNKKCWRAVKTVLYEDIQLNGCDSILHTKKKYKIKYGSRIRLLRKTLRSRPDLAALVKSLKVPSMPDTASDQKAQEEYLDLVASLVMACPNLEQLPGFYPGYNHTFSRITYALSTRKKLKESVWIIDPSPFQRQRPWTPSEGRPPVMAPGPLLPTQCVDFLHLTSNWTELKTLFLHCNPGGTIDCLLFADIWKQLPALEHLHLSGFPQPSFNDVALASLPRLKSLRLENLPGVTSNGLTAFASSGNSESLESLSLVSISLTSLPVLARLFSHLKFLTRFTISQSLSPTLPLGEGIFLHPYLASASLHYLHWECTNSDDEKGLDILAKSISHKGFPSLRFIRAPTDPDGALQKLCNPHEKIEFLTDDQRKSSSQAINDVSTPPGSSSPAKSAYTRPTSRGSSIRSPTRSMYSTNTDPFTFETSHEMSFEPREQAMSLRTARHLAQQRIEAAVTIPKYQIIVWDASGALSERHEAGGFIGELTSKIYYSLEPDITGSDEAVATINGPGGLLDNSEETSLKDGCTGSWNAVLGGGKHSSKERWWHTERGRWRDVPLKIFF